MYAGGKNMRKSRKNEIYETAMALFQKKGYESVTVMDICNACGITKKAFYYHYASKEDLISQYFQITGNEFNWEALKAEESLGSTPYHELLWQYEGYVIDCSIALGVSMGKALQLYDISHSLNIISPFMDGPHKNRIDQSEYISMVERGQTAGQLRADRSAKELLFILFSAVIGLASHWRTMGGAYDLKAEVRKIFDFVMLPAPSQERKE